MRREFVDDRKRDGLKMIEVDELAIDPSAFLGRKLAALAAQLGLHAREATLPSIAPADDGGFDQQLFPSPRRFERAFDDRQPG